MLAPTDQQKIVAGFSAISAGISGAYSVFAAWPASWFVGAAPELIRLFLVTSVLSGSWFGLTMYFMAIPAADWLAHRGGSIFLASVAGTSAVTALSSFVLTYLPWYALALIALACMSLLLLYPTKGVRSNA